MHKLLYSRLWMLILTHLVPFVLSLFFAVCFAIRIATTNRAYKAISEQEVRQSNAVKWIVAFWTLTSIPNIVLLCLEVRVKKTLTPRIVREKAKQLYLYCMYE